MKITKNMNMSGSDIDDISIKYFNSIKNNLPYGASIREIYKEYGSENIVVISYEWGDPTKSSYIKFDFLSYKRDKLIEDLLNSF